jgi:AraC-like DNA-binding protein
MPSGCVEPDATGSVARGVDPAHARAVVSGVDLGIAARSGELAQLRAVLTAADRLAEASTAEDLLVRAVSIALEELQLERVSLYLLETISSLPILRSTWGTGRDGRPTDERGCTHAVSPAALSILRSSGRAGLYLDRARLFAAPGGEPKQIAEGWSVVTPLLGPRGVIGVLYNDSAFTGSPLDPKKQSQAALFCRVIAGLHALRAPGRATLTWPATLASSMPYGKLTQSVVAAVRENPRLTQEDLARRFASCPRQLARAFKRETGQSVVEFRNRIRIERFLSRVARSEETLLDAAYSAGFGSYAQFHRIYRRLLRATPREHVTSLRRRGVSTLRNGRDPI